MNQPTTYVILISIVLILYTVFKRFYLPTISGRFGEYLVAQKLKRLNKTDYIIYNDIHLKNRDYTTQIDHLILSIYGIFVLETKNHKGWIFGNDKSKYWTQTLYRKKYKLYNPVIQNWQHVNFLKRISFEFRDLNFFPIVVFTGKAKLKRIQSSVPVIKKNRLLRTIRSNKEVYYTHDELARLDGILQQFVISVNSVKKEHKKQVKSTKKRKRNHTEINICPKCGGRLEVKHGKYGWFYGCNNFPACKFTKNVK